MKAIRHAKKSSPPPGLQPEIGSDSKLEIGTRLKHARMTKSMSLLQLAGQVGCTESFLSKVEHDKVNPSLTMLPRIVAVLEINIARLFSEESSATDPVAIMHEGGRLFIKIDSLRQGRGIMLERLISSAQAHLLQANIHHVAPQGSSDGCIAHVGEEMGYVLEGTLPIPPLAFLPIFIIWFGLGELSKVLMIAFATFFTIYVNTYQGVRYADPLLMRAARSLGAKPRHAFFTIGLPSAMPEIFTGLRLGMGMAFFVLVAAELLAADSGMGYRIQEARWQFRVDRMFFGAALIGLVGYLLLFALKRIEERLLDWKPVRQAP